MNESATAVRLRAGWRRHRATAESSMLRGDSSVVTQRRPLACAPDGAGAGCAAAAAERRYQGSSPKPPPVCAGSRLSKVFGEAEIALIFDQSKVEL